MKTVLFRVLLFVLVIAAEFAVINGCSKRPHEPVVRAAPQTQAYFDLHSVGSLPTLCNFISGHPELCDSKLTDDGTDLKYNGVSLTSVNAFNGYTLPANKAIAWSSSGTLTPLNSCIWRTGNQIFTFGTCSSGNSSAWIKATSFMGPNGSQAIPSFQIGNGYGMWGTPNGIVFNGGSKMMSAFLSSYIFNVKANGAIGFASSDGDITKPDACFSRLGAKSIALGACNTKDVSGTLTLAHVVDKSGVSATGKSCTITAITDGIITAATCTQ